MTRSLQFPETMIGKVTFRRSPSAQAHKFTMQVRWFIPDLDAFFDDPRHAVVITGRVGCDALGGTLTVPSGRVELFAEDAGRTVMNYRLNFDASNGEPLELRGAKQIVHDRAKDLWPDTTTLPVEIRQATGDQQLVLSGRLHLTLPRVLRAIAGMRASGTPREAIKTIMAFDRFFVAKLASVYLTALRPIRGRGERTANVAAVTSSAAR